MTKWNNSSVSNRKTYISWTGMLRRCQDPTHRSYKDYALKGISVCDRWQSFDLFIEDMGTRPEGRTLDRVNNKLGYYKENCRWATLLEQMRNQNKSIYYTYQGVTRPVKEWAEIKGICYWMLRRRIKKGWDESRVFSPSTQIRART